MSQSVLSAEQASRERFDAGALIGAGALVGFGLTLWIAANWDAFGKFGRFGLIGAIVAVAGAVAIAGPRLRAPASLIGVMAVGGLLALFGQTYQSGADPWQLFALWAALTLPWALAARHDAVWCAWVVIAMTAVSLWAPENRAWPWEVRTQDLPVAWIMAVALTAAMADLPVHSSASAHGGGATAAQVMVRPQSLRLAATGLPVRVLDVTFLGDTSTVQFRTGWGQEIWMRAGAEEIAGLSPGATAHIGWVPGESHLFV